MSVSNSFSQYYNISLTTTTLGSQLDTSHLLKDYGYDKEELDSIVRQIIARQLHASFNSIIETGRRMNFMLLPSNGRLWRN